MKKSVKTALIVAAALIAVGGILVAVGFALGGSLDKPTNTVTYTADEPFSDILISVLEADVYIFPSEDGTCYAECEEEARLSYELNVQNDTLSLTLRDDRRWYDHIGITYDTPTVTLYLPRGAYGRLKAESTSGDILGSLKQVYETDFSFTDVTLMSSSGHLGFFGRVQTLTAESQSGEILLSNLFADTVSAQTASGDISLLQVQAKDIRTVTRSGRTLLSRTVVSGTLEAQSSSGDIELEASDAQSLILTAESGDITGSLRTDKAFDAESRSGNVICPDSVAGGGTCVVRTWSGDISLIILR